MCPEQDDDLEEVQPQRFECPRCGESVDIWDHSLNRDGLCCECLEQDNEYEDRIREQREEAP